MNDAVQAGLGRIIAAERNARAAVDAVKYLEDIVARLSERLARSEAAQRQQAEQIQALFVKGAMARGTGPTSG